MISHLHLSQAWASQARPSCSLPSQAHSSHSRSSQGHSSHSRDSQTRSSHSSSSQAHPSHSKVSQTRSCHSRASQVSSSHSWASQPCPSHFRNGQVGSYLVSFSQLQARVNFWHPWISHLPYSYPGASCVYHSHHSVYEVCTIPVVPPEAVPERPALNVLAMEVIPEALI